MKQMNLTKYQVSDLSTEWGIISLDFKTQWFDCIFLEKYILIKNAKNNKCFSNNIASNNISIVI